MGAEIKPVQVKLAYLQPTFIWLYITLLAFLLFGCASTDNSESWERLNRASEDIAPTNPNRGQKTVEVVTNVAPELDVKIVTFYNQHAMKKLKNGYIDSEPGSRDEDCYRVERSLLATLVPLLMQNPTQTYHYNRLFYHPVDKGLQTHTILLDEVLPGKCGIRINSIGYLVKHNGNAIAPSPRDRQDNVLIGIAENGSLTLPDVVVNCTHIKPTDKKKDNDPFLSCSTPGRKYINLLGPISTSGAKIKLDFRYVPPTWQENAE